MKRTAANNKGGKVVINYDRLSAIEKQFGAKLYTRVGILGSKTNRKATGELAVGGGHKVDKKAKAPMTNAYIGLLHEKGSYTQRIPRRSFLEDTFRTRAKDLLSIKKELYDWFLRQGPAAGLGDLRKIYRLLGIKAEALVQEAFETGGFGNWPPLSALTIRLKKSSAILIDTAQLRRAVTSDVVKA